MKTLLARAGILVVVAITLAGCTSPGCPSCELPNCEIDPPGKSTGLKTSDEPFVCIPSKPGNNNATCAPFADGLKAQAAATLVGQCVQLHGVKCTQKECPNKCVPSVSLWPVSPILAPNYKGCPNPKTEDACRLLSVAADCTCFCPLVSE